MKQHMQLVANTTRIHSHTSLTPVCVTAGGQFNKEAGSTCLRVPQLAVSVVGAAEELRAVVVEADVLHRLAVADVTTYASALVVHLPDLTTHTDVYTSQI